MKPRLPGILFSALMAALIALCSCSGSRSGEADGGDLMSLYDRATDLRSEGHYEEAAEKFMAAGNLYSPSMSEEEKTICIDSYQKAGFIYLYDIHSRVLAYPMLRKALDVSLSENINKYLPVIYMNLGNIYNDFSDPSVSGKWIGKTFDLYCRGFYSSLELKDWRRLSTIMINLCSIYTPTYADDGRQPGQSRTDSLMRRMVAKFLTVPVPADVAERNYARKLALSTLEMMNGNYPRALELYRSNDVPPGTDPLVIHHLECQRTDNISHVYAAMGKTDSAIALQKKLIREAVSHSLPEIEAYASLNLSGLYNGRDEEASRDWLLRYFEKSDSLRTLNDRNTMGEIELQHKLNMERTSLEESRHKEGIRNMLLLFCLAILVLCGLFIAFLLIKHRKLTRRNEMLYQKNMELARVSAAGEPGMTDAKYAASSISDEDKKYLLGQIEKSLADTAVVCDPELSVASLAVALKSNKSYISQIINEHYGLNFRTLIGNLRVNEALRRIDADPERYSNITVDALASEIGFRSRATFTSAFRRVTGLTPAEFIRIARRRHASPGAPDSDADYEEVEK